MPSTGNILDVAPRTITCSVPGKCGTLVERVTRTYDEAAEQLRLEEEDAAEPQITERQRIDAAMNVYSRRSFSVSSTFDPASDPRFA